MLQMTNRLTSYQFISVLSSTEYLHSQYPDCIVLIGGDFNVDLDRCRTHTSILNKFCEDNDLFFCCTPFSQQC